MFQKMGRCRRRKETKSGRNEAWNELHFLRREMGHTREGREQKYRAREKGGGMYAQTEERNRQNRYRGDIGNRCPR